MSLQFPLLFYNCSGIPAEQRLTNLPITPMRMVTGMDVVCKPSSEKEA